jgi:hypothetical protein
MSSSSSSKSVLLWTTCCVFGGGNIAGSSLRKVPHLAMCGDFTLFMGCNISTKLVSPHRRYLSNNILWRFCWVVIVAIFPTKLVSPHLEFICKSYSSFRFGVLLIRIIGVGYSALPEFPVPQLIQENG